MMLVVPGSHTGTGGWLCTGDADLRSPEVQAELHKLRSDLKAVDAIAVPHHGSSKNFDALVAAQLAGMVSPNLRWVVSSGKNKWKYPASSVVAACKQHGVAYIEVKPNANHFPINF
jgi:beta-lactamase superfamily II metal-dependent hydrolase